MVIRIAASIFVMFGIGAILVADETLARSGGGFAAGRAVTSPAAIRPAGARPFIHPGPRAIGRGAALRSHAVRTRFFRHRRDGFFGWPTIWPSYEPYYAPTFDQPDGAAPYDLPSPGFPAMGYRTPYSAPVSVYVIPYRPGCESQTQNLPWTGGAERSVTIVRC